MEAWPDAKCYLVLASVASGGNRPDATIGGLRRGQTGFDNAVAEWARAWARHNRTLGLRPGQVAIQFVDEPHTQAQLDAQLAWTRAFRKGTDGILTFCTPTLSPANREQRAPAFKYLDIMCTKLWAFTNNAEEHWDFCRAVGKRDTTIWFYMCEGSVLHRDPAYYRLQPWQCLRAGAVGSAFWSYGDNGGASSWNEYAGLKQTRGHSPVYLGPDSVTNSKHWEAVREGIQDYQYVIMLRNAVHDLKRRGVRHEALGRAEKAIRELPESLVARIDERSILTGFSEWSDEVPCRHAETARREILDLLIALRGLR